MRILSIAALAALLLAGPALAHEPTLAGRDLRMVAGKLTQGGTVIGRTAPGARLTLDGKAVRVASDGAFVFGFGRKAARQSLLVVRYPDGAVEEHRLTIARRKYDIQRIDGLPSKMVTPSEEDLQRIGGERALVKAARKRDIPVPFFANGFDWPVLGRISGVYGSQRILNGQPRSPHVGIDVAAPTGTLIVAPADGEVTLTHEAMYPPTRNAPTARGHPRNCVKMHDTASVVVPVHWHVCGGLVSGR